MKWRDLFERSAPTGREPVRDRHPATREEMAALGRQFATPQPVQVQAVRRSRLFKTDDNYETGPHGRGVIF